jgi:hypothetical protein
MNEIKAMIGYSKKPLTIHWEEHEDPNEIEITEVYPDNGFYVDIFSTLTEEELLECEAAILAHIEKRTEENEQRILEYLAAKRGINIDMERAPWRA